MATTTWDNHEAPGIRPDGHPESETHHDGVGLHDMTLVRRFVSEALRAKGDAELTDDEWATLVRDQDPSASDQVAIASIILGVHGLRTPAPDASVEPAAIVSLPLPAPTVASVEQADSLIVEPTPPLPIPADFALTARPALEVPEVATSTPVANDIPGAHEDHEPPETDLHFTAWPLGEPSPLALDDPKPPLPTRRSIRTLGSRFVRKSGGSPAPSPVGPPTRTAPITRKERADERRRQRLLAATSWVRNIGIIILLFVGWQVWGTAITQHHSQEALKHQFDSGVHHAVAKPPPGFTLTPATTRIPDPPQGTVMAHLQIPKIGLDEFVVSGTNEADLAKGPGHYLGTAMPGQAGNVAIAGHRTTHGAPFNRLAELAIGDPIELTTSNGQQLTYIVSAVPVAVSPKDVTVLNNFGDDRLTLTTCNPEYSAVQRLIVVAAYLPPGATHPVPVVKGSGTPYALAPASIAGWNTSLLPWVLLEVAALVGLGLAFRRLSQAYGKGARWLILGPVWLALLLALFETLVNFLPAAV